MKTNSSSLHRYARDSRTLTYAVLATLPLLVLYETLIAYSFYVLGQPVRIMPDVWIKDMLALVGIRSTLSLSLAVVVIGAIFLVYDRRKHGKTPFNARFFWGIVFESSLYALLSGMMVSMAVGRLFAMMAPSDLGFITTFALSIGAGLYEELVFRVLLVGALFALFKQIMKHLKMAYLLSAVLGALAFSAVHYIGAMGDAFTLSSFTFRFLMGLLFSVLYLTRGFAVTAWTHALYNVFLLLGIFRLFSA